MARELFISDNIDLKELENLLTPVSLKGTDPKYHFIESIKLKTKNNIDGFINIDELPQETLYYILNFLSFLYYRKVSFSFFGIGGNMENLEMKIVEFFKTDINKWDFSDNKIHLISGSKFNTGYLLSFSYSDGEKTFLDINQEYKKINKLIISGVYISEKGFMTFIGVKKSSICKQLILLLGKILNKVEDDINKISFWDYHFIEFYDNLLNQVTKAGTFEEVKEQKIKYAISRASKDTNLKKVLENSNNLLDLRGYLLDNEFNDINIHMSKVDSFPNYSFSILKDISDEKLINLFEFLYDNLLGKNYEKTPKDILFILLDKKINNSSDIFYKLGNGYPKLEHIELKYKGLKLGYKYIESSIIDGDDVNDILIEGFSKDSHSLKNGIKIDENIEYGWILDLKDEIFKGFIFIEEIGFFKKIQHSNDESKNVLVVISSKEYNDIIDLCKKHSISNDAQYLMAIISFNKGDLNGLKNGYKIKTYRKDASKKGILFNPDFYIFDILGEGLVDFFIEGISKTISGNNENKFFNIFFSDDKLSLSQIQNIFYKGRDSKEIAIELINKFKIDIESKSSFIIQEYIKNVTSGNNRQIEKYIQNLFGITILGSYQHVLPEVDTNRGPIDFLFISEESYTIVEFKLASNPKIRDNLKFQTKTYKSTLEDVSKEIHELGVIFYEGEQEKERIEKIIEDESLDIRKYIFINIEKNISASNIKS